MNWSDYHYNFTYAVYFCCSCVQFVDALHQIDVFLAFEKFAHFNEKFSFQRHCSISWSKRNVIGLTEEFAYKSVLSAICSLSKYLILAKVYLIKLNRNDTVLSFFFSFENGKPPTTPIHTQLQLMQHVYDKVYVCFLIIEIWNAHKRVFKCVWKRMRELFSAVWHYTRE